MFVGNLGFNITDDSLRELFEGFGTVSSAKIILDRETGRSRGFGFVEMNSTEEATEAMNKLNGKEVGGRAMSVSAAREKESRHDNKKW
jgi:RNA recognition motif-containing protein